MVTRTESAERPACRIGLDLGTSAIKGVLVRADGLLLKTAERPIRYDRPRPGWVEADAEQELRDVTAVIRELATAAPGPVDALAAAGAAGSTLLSDAQGRPLTPAINWMDRRCADQPPPALAGLTAKAVRQVTGWPCLDAFPLAQLAWLLEHEPERYHAAAHVGMNTDWLLFRLTGNWLMDHSTATTMHLQDQTRRCWHKPYLERLGLVETQLPPLTHSGAPTGRLTPEAAAATGLTTDTVAFTGCFDHPAAARAVGVCAPGQLLLSCGTSWVGFLPADERDSLLAAELLCDPFLSKQGGPWGGMFSVPAIGPVIHWYVDHIIAPGEMEPWRIFDELAARGTPGAGGLTLDLSSPPRQIAAEPAQVARAVMEGAARALDAQLRRLREQGFRFTRAVLVGGPSRSPIWPGLIAETTGLELAVGSSYAGAEGAALLAGGAVGMPAPGGPHDD
ncbi:MAG: hypothetical protein K9N49_06335 [Candidatus Marinimicrobia bacterium]|nr:hypothetical protein [Candidatus Neomarinimicrobiota bacterium]